MDPIVRELRQRLVSLLTERGDTSWTCSSRRLVFRRGGQVLCKLSTAADHVSVAFPLRDVDEAEVGALPFVGPASPEEAQAGERWREARLRSAAAMDQLMEILLPSASH